MELSSFLLQKRLVGFFSFFSREVWLKPSFEIQVSSSFFHFCHKEHNITSRGEGFSVTLTLYVFFRLDIQYPLRLKKSYI